MHEKWDRVCNKLRDELGAGPYNSWIRPIQPHWVEPTSCVLRVPTRFMKDWIQTHYWDRILYWWDREEATGSTSLSMTVSGVSDQQDQNQKVLNSKAASEQEDGLSSSTISHHKGTKSNERAYVSSSSASNPYDKNINLKSNRSTQRESGPTAGEGGGSFLSNEDEFIFNAALDQRMTFENFVVGKPNELAYAAAQRVADSNVVQYNPLFLYGGVGLGKTHLMNAIAWRIHQRDPSRKVIYLSAEKFMYRFIRALRYRDTVAFKEQFRSVDVLMIDDVQFIAGKDSTQEEFFHTFNALVDQNRQIIISADKSPSDLEGMEERMKSRLGWGLVADIHPTTYELRLGILQSKSDQYSVQIPLNVLEFLAHKITSNVRELEGALNRLIAHATLVGRSISLEMAQEVLHDILKSNDRRITVEEIQKAVAEHYTIRLSDLHSTRRSRNIARPRQVAMYLAKRLTAFSLPEIGRKFGGKDHTTVIHAVKKVEELKIESPELQEDIDLLTKTLTS